MTAPDMKQFHTFKVRAGLVPKDMFVELDGERLLGVTGISFSLSSEKLTQVNLVIMGQVAVEGAFLPKEIAHVRRDMPHPGSLKFRIRETFRKLFPATADQYIDGLTANVMRDFETDVGKA